MSDEQEKIWLARVATGDEQAFRDLYDQYADKVYTKAIAYLRSPLEAQDTVQEIFLKIWEKKETLPGISHFPAWLNVITRNYLINILQKKIPSDINEGIYRQIPSGDPLQPAAQLDLKEISGLIQEAVNKLSPRQQKVYRLSREQGMTHQQVASELGISYDTVREHMGLALKNIRSWLQDHYGKIGILLSFWIRS